MEINLAAQSTGTWRDIPHLAFLTKLSFSLFSHGAVLKIILSRNLNVIFSAYCGGLTGSVCCTVILLTYSPTATLCTSKISFGYHFCIKTGFYFLRLRCSLTPSVGVWITAGGSFRAERAIGDSGTLSHAPATVPGVFTSSSYLSCSRQELCVKMHLC